MPPNYHATLIREALNMPKNLARADYCFDKALGFLLKYRNMAIPNAMKLADFSAQEQACRAKRMCLYCLWKKINVSKDELLVTPPPQVIDVSFVRTDSLVTAGGDSGGSSSQQTSSQLTMLADVAVTCIRVPVKAAQMHHAEAVQKKRRMHDAFKRATIMYARQREKPDGMSAREVVNLVERDLGIKLSQCSIQKKVKDGNIGTSPLR
jgi:hypothetical protein